MLCVCVCVCVHLSDFEGHDGHRFRDAGGDACEGFGERSATLLRHAYSKVGYHSIERWSSK